MSVLKVEARVQELDSVLDFVNGELDKLECPMRAAMQIDIAVEEIFVNIAHYAYGSGVGEAEIRMEGEAGGSGARITFLDSGVPYDPLQKEDPDITLPAAQRKIGGLGIFMVKKSMDDLSYEYRGGQNVLQLLKKW